MDDKSRPRDDAYIKYLAGLVQEPTADPTPKLLSRAVAPEKSRRSIPPQKVVLYVCGLLIALFLGLAVIGFVYPRFGPSLDAATRAQLEQEAKEWGWSGARSVVSRRLKGLGTYDFPREGVQLNHVNGNRWQLTGFVQIQDDSQVVQQKNWDAEFEYLAATKTGELFTVHLDGSLIYSK